MQLPAAAAANWSSMQDLGGLSGSPWLSWTFSLQSSHQPPKAPISYLEIPGHPNLPTYGSLSHSAWVQVHPCELAPAWGQTRPRLRLKLPGGPKTPDAAPAQFLAPHKLSQGPIFLLAPNPPGAPVLTSETLRENSRVLSHTYRGEGPRQYSA